MVTAARGVVIVTLELTNCCTHIFVDEYLLGLIPTACCKVAVIYL